MICLEMELDKNRFCFSFLKDRGHLHCFRYTTIILGFNSNPFILNCILWYHAAQFSPRSLQMHDEELIGKCGDDW